MSHKHKKHSHDYGDILAGDFIPPISESQPVPPTLLQTDNPNWLFTGELPNSEDM